MLLATIQQATPTGTPSPTVDFPTMGAHPGADGCMCPDCRVLPPVRVPRGHWECCGQYRRSVYCQR